MPAAVDPALLLDNQICALVYRLHRGITDLYRPMLTELGLTYPQYLVMLVLWEEQSATVSHLGQRLDLDSGTLSPLLKRLEANGLVTRQRSEADERAVEVSLTAAGRRLRAKASDIPRALGQCLGTSPAEYLALRDQLEGLVTRVSAATS